MSQGWEQRYAGLEAGRVRYESVGSDFQRDLHVDDEDLVIDYPGPFKRVHISARSRRSANRIRHGDRRGNG
jgi:hypothetical protein